MQIKLDRPKCIGCGSCAAVCPLFFEMVEDGKSHLKSSQKDAAEIESLEVAEMACAKEAADVCPVQIIKIE
ncbi:MAG: ferredoxin [bacterium]